MANYFARTLSSDVLDWLSFQNSEGSRILVVLVLKLLESLFGNVCNVVRIKLYEWTVSFCWRQ